MECGYFNLHFTHVTYKPGILHTHIYVYYCTHIPNSMIRHGLYHNIRIWSQLIMGFPFSITFWNSISLHGSLIPINQQSIMDVSWHTVTTIDHKVACSWYNAGTICLACSWIWAMGNDGLWQSAFHVINSFITGQKWRNISEGLLMLIISYTDVS